MKLAGMIPAELKFGKEAISPVTTKLKGGKIEQEDYEKMAHGMAAILAQLATLKGGKEAAETPIGESTVLNAPKAGVREILGVGERSVNRARAAAEEAATEKMTAYKEKVADAKAKHDAAIAEKQAEHEAAVEAAKAKHQAQLDAAELSMGEKVTKEAHARLRNTRLEQAEKKLTDFKDQTAQQVAKNVDQAEKAEKGSLDARWTQFRKQVLGVTPEAPNGTLQAAISPVGEAVLNARKNILKGSKTNIQIFNDILNNRLKEMIEMPDGTVRPLEGQMIPADQLRGYYTEFNDALYEKDLPSDVRNAIKSVQKSVDNEIQAAIADTHGKGAVNAYGKLKSDYTDYMDTWRDVHSGSPLPRVLKVLRAPVASKMGVTVYPDAARYLLREGVGRKTVELMARKSQFGADPSLVAKLMAADKKLSGLKEFYNRIPVVKNPRFPQAKPVEPFKPKPFEAPKPPDIEQFDPEKFRKQKAGEEMHRIARWGNIGVVVYALRELAQGKLPSPELLSYPIVQHLVMKVFEGKGLDWLAREGKESKGAPPAKPPTYKPSEKAATMSGERKSLGREFEEGERTHEVERYRSILRNPKATNEDRVIAMQRLSELGATP